MSLVTEFSVDATAFALGHTLEAVPEMRVEGEQMVTHSDEWVLPFLWAAGGSFERFDGAMEDDPTIETFEPVDAFDSTRLYRFVWTDDIRQVIRKILNQDGMLLEATGQDDTWNLKIRFSHRDQLSGLQESFVEQTGTFTLKRLYEPDEPEERTYNLTTEQREVLLLALHSGYFAVPRETTTDELAAMLGISSPAVSERLRRAHATLVANALTYSEPSVAHTENHQPDE